MDAPIVHKGVRFLRRYLKRHAFDFRAFDLSQFKSWLSKQLALKQRDAASVQRCEIRDLKKKHSTQLTALKLALRDARQQWGESPNKQQIEDIEQKIDGNHKAIAGLEKAVQTRSGQKRDACREKLQSFRRQTVDFERQLEQMVASTPEKAALEKAQRELDHFSQKIGLPEKEARLQQLLTEQGQHKTRAGSKFEETSHYVLDHLIVPMLRRRNAEIYGRRAQLQTLSQVKLGCARAELDHVVIWTPAEEGPVDVLGIVEVKRNINDVASGFTTRQENLHWFTGREAHYDPQLYRTKVFRHGHFDQPVHHTQDGRRFLFTPESFRRLAPRDDGYFLDSLFFITTYRKLINMSSAEHSKIMFRVATDIQFSLDDDNYLRHLQEWANSVVSPWQTRNVIELYTGDRALGQQFFVEEH